MKVTIITIGSRGDVQPFLALAIGLKHAGHQIKLATYESFAPWIRSYGIEFVCLEGDPYDLLQSEAGQQMMESAKNPIQFMNLFSEVISPTMDGLMSDAWSACQNADVIICHCILSWVREFTKKLKIPCYITAFAPLAANTEYPIALTSGKSMGKLLNYLSYPVYKMLFWQLFRSSVNRWLQKHFGVSPYPIWAYPQIARERHQQPQLYAYSPTILPRASNWPENIHVTGYWYLKAALDWQPSDKLIDFLDAGSPPIYIGFGSMKDRNPEEITDIVLKAIAKTQNRAILSTGWGGISNADLPDGVLKIDSVPHDWLFPQCAALVHHGGAGTTSAGLRAGIPSVILPFLGDQMFWGNRLASYGIGTEPIFQKELTPEKLSEAIAQVTNSHVMSTKATQIGKKIRAEDGVANAVKVLEQDLSLN